MWAPNADTGGSTVNFTPWWPGASRVDMVGLDGYPQSGLGWWLCNFQELFGQSFTEMKSLTSLPVFISETDLAPLSTSRDCNGGSYETITNFMSDLFSRRRRRHPPVPGRNHRPDQRPVVRARRRASRCAALGSVPGQLASPIPGAGEHTSHRRAARRAYAREFLMPDA